MMFRKRNGLKAHLPIQREREGWAQIRYAGINQGNIPMLVEIMLRPGRTKEEIEPHIQRDESPEGAACGLHKP
jgi:hypothetical protein